MSDKIILRVHSKAGKYPAVFSLQQIFNNWIPSEFYLFIGRSRIEISDKSSFFEFKQEVSSLKSLLN